MEAEPAPAMTESHEHDMPTSQEIRLYERCGLHILFTSYVCMGMSQAATVLDWTVA